MMRWVSHASCSVDGTRKVRVKISDSHAIQSPSCQPSSLVKIKRDMENQNPWAP